MAMKQSKTKQTNRVDHDDASLRRCEFDLDELLHPAQAFSHPCDVVADPDLTLNEKRAILASWASDACAVDSSPGLRHAGPGRSPVGFDDVMDALRALDREANEASARYLKHTRRRRIFGRWRRDGGQGSTPLQA
jgi:hypothetical protein